MARKKKEEIEEVVSDEEQTEVVTEKEKVANQIVIDEIAGVDLTAGEDQTAETYTRVTPFGVEVWDPKTKTTTMKTHG